MFYMIFFNVVCYNCIVHITYYSVAHLHTLYNSLLWYVYFGPNNMCILQFWIITLLHIIVCRLYYIILNCCLYFISYYIILFVIVIPFFRSCPILSYMFLIVCSCMFVFFRMLYCSILRIYMFCYDMFCFANMVLSCI